jgi:hypothetical protein
LSDPSYIGIDASGNVWVADANSAEVTEFSGSGAVLSGARGYTGGGLSASTGALAFNESGDVWVVSTNTLTELSSSGNILSGKTADNAAGVALDGSGNLWVSSTVSQGCCSYIGEYSATGSTGMYSVVSEPGSTMAVDGSGDVWMLNAFGSGATEFVGAGTPVVTPLAVGVKNHTLGTRP